METLTVPFVWLLSVILWAVAWILAIAFLYSLPIILFWIGWTFFKKELIKAGIKEEWVRQAKERYFRILVRFFKFWLFDLPAFVYRTARSLRQKFGDWLRIKSPVWHARLHWFRVV